MHTLNEETTGRFHALTASGSTYDIDLDRMAVRNVHGPEEVGIVVSELRRVEELTLVRVIERTVGPPGAPGRRPSST